jgi:chromodomain-helicase-DNA-binding protein 7
MGLGKTAQAVMMLQCVRTLHGAIGPSLVVVPLSTLQHWVRELREWTSLDTIVFYGNKDARGRLCEMT